MSLQDHRQTKTYTLVPHEATPKWRALTHGELSDFRFEAVREDTQHSRLFTVNSTQHHVMSRLKDSAAWILRAATKIRSVLGHAVLYTIACPLVACYCCIWIVFGFRKCGNGPPQRPWSTGCVRRYRPSNADRAAEEGVWIPSPTGPYSFSVIPPPALAPRRAITPPPGHSCDGSQPSSNLFSRLPVEIRFMILKEAFGGQTVHLDRVFEPPRERIAPDKVFARVDGVDEDGQGPLYSTRHTGNWERSRMGPREYQWRSSVCHRNLPARDVLHTSWMEIWRPPYYDTCSSGSLQYCCNAWPGPWPLKCTVGAMGWLTTCRQAYTEGVSILYGTNTFHLPQHGLKHIDRFIRPAHLARISRLEVNLATRYHDKPSRRQGGVATYQLTITPGLTLYEVLASCGDVRRLFIGLKVRQNLSARRDQVDITPLLEEMDKLLTVLPRVQGVSLAFPYVNMKKLTGESDPRGQELSYHTSYQLWRRLGEESEAKQVEWRRCSYPKHASPVDKRGQLLDAGERGYWIFKDDPNLNQLVYSSNENPKGR